MQFKILITFSIIAFTSSSHHIRKLQFAGSNCILIETGKVPRYYSCTGCVVEQAQQCIDDMRQNRSRNVDAECFMSFLSETQNPQACCPRLTVDGIGRPNLAYVGSAYPLAFECLTNIGCAGSKIYSDLVEECLSICDPESFLDQNGGPACFAQFNSSSRIIFSKILISMLIAISIIFGIFL